VLTGGSKKQILVVEDDPDLRDALGEALSDEGYSVAGAGHGAEALDLLGEAKAARPRSSCST
jgi:CheY-like chemotaxis protein